MKRTSTHRPRTLRFSFLITCLLSLGLLYAQQPGSVMPVEKWPVTDIAAMVAGQMPTPDLGGGMPLGGGPINDNCQGATIVDLEANGSVTVTGDNTGATDGIGAGVPQVWEAFTISECLDITVSYCGNDPVFDGTFTSLFVGCPFNNLVQLGQGTVDQTTCADGNFTIFFPQVPVGTYYFAVLSNGASSGEYSITFSGTPCTATPPVNDECDGAIELIPSPVCEPILGDVDGALVSGGSLPAISCAGFTGNAQDDVWFQFTATATEHTIIVAGSPQFDATVDLRAGECGSTVNIDCADNVGQGGTEVLNATGLNIGETYFVRVNHWYAGLAGTTTFEICVLGPAPGDCQANAGTLSGGGTVCLEEGNALLVATPTGNAVVPVGFESIYVLTQGAGLIILDTSSEPEFTVSAEGTFTIHRLVYDPLTLDLSIVEPGVTTGFDVNALLIQGGGEICGSLGVAGAAFNVAVCPPPCDADAGTLNGGGVACVVAGTSPLLAFPDGNAVVPDGFEVIYVLTFGNELTIIDVAAEPEFIAEELGIHTIHTLVYDPATLDLSVVEIGVTTGFDVNALLIQGGGDICASLNVAGAVFSVEDCQPQPCDAFAGTLTPVDADPCLEGDLVILLAAPGDDAVVPEGYQTLYVLTAGEELVIINAQSEPFFGVDDIGLYTIHTLVYDPNTLDLSMVEIGVTTGFEVNALLIQGGGEICASLDVAGAAFNVTVCPPACDADAGTLVADTDEICLLNGSAVISATPQGDAVVPDGYELAHVLTIGPGLVIVGLSIDPTFSLTAAGVYTIHTIVYDPALIDPSEIELGVTTGFDINALLIQGGGSICGALDVAGAQVTVLDCTPANDLCTNAAPIAIELDCVPVSGDNTYSVPGPGDPNCDFSNLGYTDVWYTFNAGLNTTVDIDIEPIGMTDWGIVVLTACGGTEVACEVQPSGPFPVAVTPGADYVVRVFTNLQFGVSGTFTLCLTGAVPSVFCEGGNVVTSEGSSTEFVCQDGQADVIAFVNSSSSNEPYNYILTDASNVIITQVAGISLDFNALPLGEYRVWGVSYNGTLLGATPGNGISEVSASGTCFALSTGFVTVFVEICTGVEGLSTTAWSLFPNPTQGDLTLRHNGADAEVALRVHDMGGRMIYQDMFMMASGGVQVLRFAEGLVPGVYTVQLIAEGRSSTLRLVVQR